MLVTDSQKIMMSPTYKLWSYFQLKNLINFIVGINIFQIAMQITAIPLINHDANHWNWFFYHNRFRDIFLL